MKQIEVTLVYSVPDLVSEIDLLTTLTDFAEQKGWTVGGGAKEIKDEEENG
jgi:hypothetical protein